ncbi:hypothetical protein [Peribacillus frigoritolerans]|uniref:hypothetical protein n=1 Tax=Peribacillus frigoritolerans TaxID=450367 RepID=UPI003D2B6FAD
MDKEQLRVAISNGAPIAHSLSQLERKKEKASHPLLISVLLMVIPVHIFNLSMYTDAEADEMGFFVLLFVSIIGAFILRLLCFLPILNLIYFAYSGLLGNIIFFGKIKQLKREIENTYIEFSKKTGLPRTYCDTSTLNRFAYYLDHFLADNLKECAQMLDKERKHNQMMNKLEDIHEEAAAAADLVERNGDQHRYYK